MRIIAGNNRRPNGPQRKRKRPLRRETLEDRRLLAANLIGHWNANDLNDTLETGVTVDAWIDSQASIVANASGQPRLIKDALFGRSVVRFDTSNGTDSLRIDPDDSPMSGIGDFTVAVVFATDQELDGHVDDWFEGTGLVDATVFRGFAASWGLALNELGQVAAGIGGPASTVFSSSGNLNDGFAHAAIFTRSGETISLSVDGSPPEMVSGVSAAARTNAGVTFGAVSRGGKQLDGDLADIRFYDGALSEAEVRELYDQLADKYITPVYDPAIGVADEYLVDAGTLFSVDAANGVLANEINIDELTLSATVIANVSAGTLVLESDGSFAYDPGDFTGTATFSYLLNDSVADQNVVSVTLLVDTMPAATNDFYTIDEDSPLVTSTNNGVLANDLDADGDTFTAAIVDAPQHGTLTLAVDGSFTYEPDRDYFGVDFFTYAIDDGDQVSLPATATVVISAVNDPPVAVIDGYYLQPNTTLTLQSHEGVISNDFDVDSGALAASVIDLPMHGTLSLAEDGSFVYVPQANFAGIDRYSYGISDGELDGSAGVVELFVGMAPVEISEFMTHNYQSLRTRTRTDVESSFTGDTDSHDWIEIHNRSAFPFDIGGMFLSDDAQTPRKWQFPVATIVPGYEHLIVFASGLDVRDPALDETGALHTNFRLTDSGETPVLSNADGSFASGFSAPGDQHPDVSFGLRDGDAGYLATPSPGAANSALLLGVLDEVSFSVARGFHDAPFDVELSTSSPGANIYYTLDGSLPTPQTASRYTAPISVTRLTTLRATAFQVDYVPSHPVTHSYFFIADILSQAADPAGFPDQWGNAGAADYEMDARVVFDTDSPYYDPRVSAGLRSLPSISVVMDVDDFFGGERGIQSFPQARGSDWERASSVEFIDFEQFEDFQLDAGIRMVGNASRGPDRRKHNMRLAFRDDYGFSKLDLPLFGLGPGEAHDNLILRGGNGDSWVNQGVFRRAQYIRDQWQRDVQLAMGHQTTHQLYAHLYINGLYWGLYHVFERHDASFMALNFGGEEEDYEAIKDVNGTSNVEPVDGDTQAWLDLMNMVDSDLTVAEKYAQVDQLVDLDNMIDYLLINFYHGNNDWDHNNFRTGRHKDGTFVFFTWDAERADINSLQVNANQIGPVDRDITHFSKPNRPTRIHAVLSEYEEYRVRFADRVQRHLFNDGPLSPVGASTLWNARADEIRLALAAESARWGDLHPPGDAAQTVADWEAILDLMNNEFFPVRTDIVVDQLRGRSMYPDVVAPVFNQHGGNVAHDFDVEITNAEGVVWFTTDGSDPRLVGGAISPSARRYSAPTSLLGDTTVNARVLLDGVWSALNSATFIVDKTPADLSNLRISEVHYHPGVSAAAEVAAGFVDSDDFEFIELANISDEAIDLANVELVRVDNQGVAFDFATVPNASLEPGERVVVVENLAAFQFRYGGKLPVAGQWSGGLSNNRERLSLAASGEIIQQFTYDDDWYLSTDGGGKSLEIVDVAHSDLAAWQTSAIWRASEIAGGTPGRSAVPGDFAGDGNVGGDDIELLHKQIRLGANAYSFDFDDDGLVDLSDLNDWLTVAEILPGDANLDGRVEALDFEIWSDHRFTANAGWKGADFNADGATDVSDFNIWNDNRTAPAAAAGNARNEQSAFRRVEFASRRHRQMSLPRSRRDTSTETSLKDNGPHHVVDELLRRWLR